jgi:hypothetical protein
VFVGVVVVVVVVDGKATFGSDAPAGLFAAKLNGDWKGCDPGCEGVGLVPNPVEVGWLVAPKGGVG